MVYSNEWGRDREDFPMLPVNYHETSAPPRVVRSTEVNKLRWSGVLEEDEVIRLFTDEMLLTSK